MRLAPDLVLRDIHQPPAPSLWPLAPGWWLVLAILVVVGLAAFVWWHRRRQRRITIERLFDDTVDAAPDAPAQVAAMSALLRRAARRHRDDADVLDGDAWLEALDADAKLPLFKSGIGRLMLDGGYRKELDAADVAVLRGIARTRFLEWMGAAR